VQPLLGAAPGPGGGRLAGRLLAVDMVCSRGSLPSGCKLFPRRGARCMPAGGVVDIDRRRDWRALDATCICLRVRARRVERGPSGSPSVGGRHAPTCKQSFSDTHDRLPAMAVRFRILTARTRHALTDATRIRNHFRTHNLSAMAVRCTVKTVRTVLTRHALTYATHIRNHFLTHKSASDGSAPHSTRPASTTCTVSRARVIVYHTGVQPL
jgi:hypothetical protein